MFIDGVNYKNIMVADKTRVVYHKNSDWRNRIYYGEKQESAYTDDDLLENNRLAGLKMAEAAKRSKEELTMEDVAEYLRTNNKTNNGR